MRKDKILYDIKEAVRAYSNDAKLTDAYVMHLVDTNRADYIRQHQKRNPGEDKVNYTQTLIASLEVVDRSYMPEIPVGVSILRTTKKIPPFIGRNVLKNVEIRPVDRISQEIEYLEKSRAIYGDSSTFIFSFLDDDGHIYFLNKSSKLHLLLKQAAITVILEVPDDITYFHEDSTFLEEYPITLAMWSIVKPAILQIISASLQVPIDTVDDNNTVQ